MTDIEFGNPRYHANGNHNSYQSQNSYPNQNNYQSGYRNEQAVNDVSTGIYRAREEEEPEPTTTEFPTTERTTTYKYETTVMV